MHGKTIAIAVLAGIAGSASAASYSWEDGGTILGSFGNVANPQNVASGTDGITAFDGNRMLRVEESPNGGTPQAYIAAVTGLTDGDTVTASFWGWDDTPGASPSLRIWGHYAPGGDFATGFAGSAGGNNTFTDGSGWGQVTHTWTFDSNGGSRDTLVIEARLYSLTTPDATPFYIDLVDVQSSAGTIVFPVPAPASAALLGLGGLAMARRRR